VAGAGDDAASRASRASAPRASAWCRSRHSFASSTSAAGASDAAVFAADAASISTELSGFQLKMYGGLGAVQARLDTIGSVEAAGKHKCSAAVAKRAG
jgi:hypothetical protein